MEERAFRRVVFGKGVKGENRLEVQTPEVQTREYQNEEPRETELEATKPEVQNLKP